MSVISSLTAAQKRSPSSPGFRQASEEMEPSGRQSWPRSGSQICGRWELPPKCSTGLLERRSGPSIFYCYSWLLQHLAVSLLGVPLESLCASSLFVLPGASAFDGHARIQQNEIHQNPSSCSAERPCVPSARCSNMAACREDAMCGKFSLNRT